MFDDFEDELDHPELGDMEDIGGMQQFEQYQKMGVDTIISNITTLSDNLINSTCDFYLSNSELFDENDRKYINAIKGSEKNNLQVLLKQVKYVEHILDNLMRQLDSGGFMESTIYTTIQEMQKSSMEITMQVSKYTRNLPDYFKYVKIDIEQSKEQERLLDDERDDIIAIGSRSKGTREIAPKGGNPDMETGNDERFDRPYRGVRALLMDLENEESSLDIAIEQTKGTSPEPIIINVDGEEEIESEEFEDIDHEEETE